MMLTLILMMQFMKMPILNDDDDDVDDQNCDVADVDEHDDDDVDEYDDNDDNDAEGKDDGGDDDDDDANVSSRQLSFRASEIAVALGPRSIGSGSSSSSRIERRRAKTASSTPVELSQMARHSVIQFARCRNPTY